MREKLQTEDYIKIAGGFSVYIVLIISVMSAREGTYWPFGTAMGVGIGAFLVAFIVPRRTPCA